MTLRVKMVLQVTCSLSIFTLIKPQLLVCLGKLQESVTMDERPIAGECLGAQNYELLFCSEHSGTAFWSAFERARVSRGSNDARLCTRNSVLDWPSPL